MTTTTTSVGSSRIIVKNIGKTTTESQLRDIFNRKGEVTDVRIQKTKSGKSREFAFIGFRTEQQAIDAQSYFHNTFIQTSKISVDIAKSIHDPTLLISSKSRHSKQKLDKQKLLNKKENDQKNKIKNSFIEKINQPMNEKQERSKAEFLQVMKSRRSGNVWGNDDAHIQLAQEKLQQEYHFNEQEKSHVNDDDDDDDESDHSEDNDIVLNKISSKTSKLSQKFTHDSDSGDDESGSEDEIVKGKKGKPTSSDLDFLRSKVKKNLKEDSDSDSESEDEEESEEEEEDDEEMEVAKDDIHDPESSAGNAGGRGDGDGDGDGEVNVEEEGRLFIRNLPYSVSEDEVTELFSKFGPLSHVHLPLNEDKRGKGYGFVQFMIPEHSENAMTSLDGTSFQGRLLHIIRAKAQQSHAAAEENATTKNSHLSSFQKKKEEERKKMANKREGWNASYVRSDTVIDSLSDK
jgi:multiple RNA-binding domain-containing protein 1